MSVGMNVMFRVVQEVAEALGPDYDVEILEAHIISKRIRRAAPR